MSLETETHPADPISCCIPLFFLPLLPVFTSLLWSLVTALTCLCSYSPYVIYCFVKCMYLLIYNRASSEGIKSSLMSRRKHNSAKIVLFYCKIPLFHGVQLSAYAKYFQILLLVWKNTWKKMYRSIDLRPQCTLVSVNPFQDSNEKSLTRNLTGFKYYYWKLAIYFLLESIVQM